jgi:hypothetical protein
VSYSYTYKCKCEQHNPYIQELLLGNVKVYKSIGRAEDVNAVVEYWRRGAAAGPE